MTPFLDYISENGSAIGARLLEHITIVAAALAIALPLGVALAILLSRKSMRRSRGLIFYVMSLGQTIPSLAVLALAVGLFGIGSLPAILAIAAYVLFPIARNTLSGLESVPPETLDAATGMGLTPGRILREIELPLALPFLIAGVRVATIYAISAGALAYLIGGGGLGDFIFTGIALFRPEAMLAGAIPTAALALIADGVLGILERRGTSWRTASR